MSFLRIKTILYYVTTSSGSLEAFEKFSPFCLIHKASLVELFVLDPLVIMEIARSSGKSRSQVEIEQEENGWTYLYEIEEVAKDTGIHVEVSLQIGNPLDKILEVRKMHQCELIVLPFQMITSSKRLDRLVQDLLLRSPVPLLILPF